MNEDYLRLEFENEEFYCVGCIMCEENIWTIASNGKGFIAKCANCGHTVKLNVNILRDKPNQKAIDTRFFS